MRSVIRPDDLAFIFERVFYLLLDLHPIAVMAYPISTSMEDVARFFSGSVPASQSSSNSNNQLYIISQKTHTEETISRNGIPKHIHLVIKNSPFNITIGSLSNNSVDFNRIAFEASLLYDEGGKEVDYVKSKPVEFKSSCSEG